MGEAPKGKQAFRKAYNREMKKQADAEVFGGEIIPPKPRRNMHTRVDLTPELKEDIIQRVASGELLKHVLASPDMPSRFSVFREYERDPEFAADMKAARQVAADLLAEEVLEISDDAREDYKSDGSINYELVARSKLRADNRKWLASKFDPARFSDKVQTDITSGGEKIEAKEISPIEQARQVAFALELAKRSALQGKED
jgi:hypothetical protein